MEIALLLAVLVFVVDSQTVPYNNVTSRYFIGEFNGDEFPFAMNKCQPKLLVSPTYFMFECISSTKVRKSSFLNNLCTIASSTNNTETYTIDDITNGQYSGELYDFNCDDDAIDAYAELDLTIAGCDSSSNNFYTVYAALSVCTQVPDLTRTVNVYCTTSYDGETNDDYYVELEYFDYGSTCGDQNYSFSKNATNECGYLLTSQATGLPVYGTAVDCYNCGDACQTVTSGAITFGINNVFLMGISLISLLSLLLFC